MIDAAGNIVPPTFLPSPRPPVLLAIDAHQRYVCRYERKKIGKGFLTIGCKLKPAEVVSQLGAYQATSMLETFRVTGRP